MPNQLTTKPIEFQDTLDNASIQLDKTIDRELSILIKKSTKTIAVVETLTNGALSYRLSKIIKDHHQWLGAVICASPIALIKMVAMTPQAVQVPASSPEFAQSLLDCITHRLKSDIYITVTGAQGQPDQTSITQKAKIVVAIQCDGERRIKALELEGDKSTIQLKAVQSALMILKQWLTAKTLGG
jgi:nicotinamide mononucleotide (NMN) deamidase PncC